MVDLQRALLRWYDRTKRDLPWRQDGDPYRVWVSEVMLQQTRVDTVIPYYERWLERFPTVTDLAEAEVDDVLRSWAGLGYYSRARNLHGAARLIRERYRGQVPGTYAELRALPGVGEYTAGAIASIAFQQQEPVVDGNVNRVLHRLHDRPGIAARELRAIARSLVPPDRPGDFNQALMELGATVCRPLHAKCGECPLAFACLAHERGTQLERPAAKAGKKIPTRELDTVLLRDVRGRVLVRRRPLDGLLGGLWEFPERQHVPGLPAAVLAEAGSVEHVFSHFRARYRIQVGRVRALRVQRPLTWVALSDLDTLALSTAQRRIASKYLESP